MKKKMMGLAGIFIGSATLAIGNTQASDNNYDFSTNNLSVARRTNVYSQSGIKMVPVTNSDGGDLRLSLTDESMQRVYVDTNGEEIRIIDDDKISTYLSEQMISGAGKVNAGNRTVYVSNSGSWDGVFAISRQRDEIFINKYVPVLSLESPDKSRKIDLIHAGDPGIVTHLMYWENSDEGYKLIETEELGTIAGVERQRAISRQDKDNILRNLE